MSGPIGHQSGRNLRTISYTQVIGLSREIHSGIPAWPGDPQIEFEDVALLETDGYFLRRFAMSEHAGTHMNAPRSFFADGPSIAAYSAESLVSPASVIDVWRQVAADPDYALTMGDLQGWESQHGRVEKTPGTHLPKQAAEILATLADVDYLDTVRNWPIDYYVASPWNNEAAEVGAELWAGGSYVGMIGQAITLLLKAVNKP